MDTQTKKTLVMKFGGTSVGTPEAMHQAAEIVQHNRQKWARVVVVTSALGGVTDLLLGSALAAMEGNRQKVEEIARGIYARHEIIVAGMIAQGDKRDALLADVTKYVEELTSLCHAIEVLGEATPRALDAVASLGERMAIRVLAGVLDVRGLPVAAVEASRLICTDDTYQNAHPLIAETTNQTRQVLLPLLEAGIIPVVTGFIGANRNGTITTLGRGGSDYTAALLGAVLPADEVWIYTDVDGVMTADPRIVPAAHTIDTLSFREVAELAYFGAKVLHPKTIRPVIEAGIGLRVLNTFNPSHPGTRLVADMAKQDKTVIKAVTAIPRLRLITLEGRGMLGVPGVAARTFAAIASTGTSVPLISQASSEQSICFAVPSSAVQVVIDALQKEFEREIAQRDIDRVWATEDVVVISVVGAGMRSTPGVAGKVFSVLGEKRLNVIAIAQGSSEVSISFILSAEDGKEAVRTLHTLIE